VRVSGAGVEPTEPISAGSNGGNLRVQYGGPNDGTATELTATVTNNQPEDFEHGRIRFLMDAASAPYLADAGELVQTVIDGDIATCYVDVAFPSGSAVSVTVSPDESSGVGGASSSEFVLAGPPTPNPATEAAQIGFSLARETVVRVNIYDVTGRCLARIWNAPLPRGEHRVTWDLRTDDGSEVASGIYFFAVESSAERASGRLVVLR
jgi:hypothetical protein